MFMEMGDFNAKVGQGLQDIVVGAHGLGKRNERGLKLRKLCVEHQLVITSTFVRLAPRRLYTWISPIDGIEGRVCNQIDYILINRGFRSSIKIAKTLWSRY